MVVVVVNQPVRYLLSEGRVNKVVVPLVGLWDGGAQARPLESRLARLNRPHEPPTGTDRLQYWPSNGSCESGQHYLIFDLPST